MIIDFHTHVFPDQIAERTLLALAAASSSKPYSDGTALGLIDKMKCADADLCVNLPVLTKPKQFESVLNFAVIINEKFKKSERRIISFAGMHPLCDDISGKMKKIRESGVLGIKIHPDYQNTYIDDEKYYKIISAAADNDLIVVTHAGVDYGFKDQSIKCPPDRLCKLFEKICYKKMVLAHYGGHKQWQEVLEKLVDFDVFFDTAFTFHEINKDLFLKILDAHGDDKILFATDNPWRDINIDKNIFLSYGLQVDTYEKIFYKNASKLLKLE